jgi:hypothetical protein
MKNDETIGVRVPGELRDALERERQRMSKAAGAEVKTSAVIRAILLEKLNRRRNRVVPMVGA